MAEAHPREIDGFTIVRPLGAGGMGVVYLAQHPRLGRLDALKVLPEQLTHSEEFRERFLQEASLAARVQHPNLLTVYDQRQAERVVRASGEAGTPADRLLYIHMQYVDGPDLAQLLQREAPLPVERVLGLVQQVAGALDALHRSGLVHLDVKPSNILVVDREWREGTDRPLLTDFGVARVVSATASLDTASVMGSVAYMAPERLEHSARAPASDVYALGVTLYELLTGRLPFDGTYEAIIAGHVGLAAPAASRSRPELPLALDAVIVKALAKRPEDRWGSAGELASAARAAWAGRDRSRTTQPPPGPGPVATGPSGPPAGPRREGAARTGPAAWALTAGAFTVVGVLALAGWATGVFPPDPVAPPSTGPGSSGSPSSPTTPESESEPEPEPSPDPPTRPTAAAAGPDPRPLTELTPVSGASSVIRDGDSLVMPCASGRSDDRQREVRYEQLVPVDRFAATISAEGQADPAARLQVELIAEFEEQGAPRTRRAEVWELRTGQSLDADAAVGERRFVLRLTCLDPRMQVRFGGPGGGAGPPLVQLSDAG